MPAQHSTAELQSPLQPSEMHVGPEEAERVLYSQTGPTKPCRPDNRADTEPRSHPEACSGPETSTGITFWKQPAFPSGSFQIAFEVDLGPEGNPRALRWEVYTMLFHEHLCKDDGLINSNELSGCSPSGSTEDHFLIPMFSD